MKALIRFTFIFLCCLTSSMSKAQFKVSVGYNLARFTTPQRNFEILAFETNRIQPGLKIPNMLHGASLGFRFGDEGFLLEFLFTNKKFKSSEFNYFDESHQEDYRYQIKTRLRTFNAGIAMGGDVVKIGASLDVGGFKIFSKNLPVSEFNQKPWNRFYGSHSFFTGYTIFVPITMEIVEFRIYYQGAFFYDDFLGFRNYTHKANNFGANLSFLIGRN
ncbi:MAG: hypothetical protein EP338_10190 [Bacteroidetes bacterium]|nr:MAG: hypothetical protein EP338_10190 [Bacteroidota bacterium]